MALLISAVSALAPIKAVLITVAILIIADMISGIIAAYKRGEQITSAALGRTITKMFVYQTVVISGYLMQEHLINNLIPVVSLIGGVIGMVEFKSLLENANEILGMDLFKEIIKQFSSKNNLPPSQKN